LKDFLSNRPPATEPTLLKQTPNEYADQKTTAVVVAALRPMGKVKIGEKEHNARHIFGTFIDSGTTVMVTGMQNGLLLVREAIGEADTGTDH
jgi:membrane-bound ClpP family serine protease